LAREVGGECTPPLPSKKLRGRGRNFWEQRVGEYLSKKSREEHEKSFLKCVCNYSKSVALTLFSLSALLFSLLSYLCCHTHDTHTHNTPTHTTPHQCDKFMIWHCLNLESTAVSSHDAVIHVGTPPSSSKHTHTHTHTHSITSKKFNLAQKTTPTSQI